MRATLRPPALVSDEELLRRYHVDGDRRARDELVERLLPLARRLAGRYAHGGAADDLFQVASLGLVKAIDRFDVTRRSSLERFAVPTMLGELKRHMRDTRWGLRVPRALQERALEVSRVVAELTATLGTRPGLPEVADSMGLEPEEVADAFAAFAAMDPASIEAPVRREDDTSISSESLLGAHDAGYDRVDAVASIEPAINALSSEERRVLAMRYVGDLTQSEIGRRLGASQIRVSRTLRRAVGRIRHELGLPAPVAGA